MTASFGFEPKYAMPHPVGFLTAGLLYNPVISIDVFSFKLRYHIVAIKANCLQHHPFLEKLAYPKYLVALLITPQKLLCLLSYLI